MAIKLNSDNIITTGVTKRKAVKLNSDQIIVSQINSSVPEPSIPTPSEVSAILKNDPAAGLKKYQQNIDALTRIPSATYDHDTAEAVKQLEAAKPKDPKELSLTDCLNLEGAKTKYRNGERLSIPELVAVMRQSKNTADFAGIEAGSVSATLDKLTGNTKSNMADKPVNDMLKRTIETPTEGFKSNFEKGIDKKDASYLNVNEQEQYNRLVSINPVEAKKYLKSKEDKINMAKGIEVAQEYINGNKFFPALYTYIGTGVSNIGWYDAFEGFEELMTGKKMDERKMSVAEYANAYLANYFTENGKGFDKLIQDVIVNSSNNVIAALPGVITKSKAIGRLSFALSVFGTAYREERENGYTPQKSALYALANSVSETTLESLLGVVPGVGEDNVFIKKLSQKCSNVLGKFLIKLVGKTGSEYIEESTQFALDPFLRKLILGEDPDTIINDFEDQSKGMAYSGAVGAFSALLMGGMGTVSETIHEHNTENYGKMYRLLLDSSDISLIDAAKYTMNVSDKGSSLYKTSERIVNGKDKVTDYTAGNLYNEINKFYGSAKTAVNAVIGQSVKAQENGVENVFAEFGKAVSEGAQFSDEIILKADMLRRKFDSGTQPNDAEIGEFVRSITANTPAAFVQNEFNKQRENHTAQNSELQSTANGGIINTDITEEIGDDADGSTDTELLAGREISAAGRSQNHKRKYGANTEIIRGSLGDAQSATGISNRNVAAGESGWISARDFPFARTVGIGLDENFLRVIRESGIKVTDSIGRNINSQLQKRLSETVFKTENGTVISFFHWSPNSFKEFKYGDGAFHLGTLSAAIAVKQRDSQKREGFILESYVVSKNPIVIPDVGQFGAYSICEFLLNSNIITKNELKNISQEEGFFSDKYDAPANVYVRELLKSKGYDSYLYQNRHEDTGSWSVGVFDADQIIIVAENGVLKEGCGVTETDSDPSTPDGSQVGEGLSSEEADKVSLNPKNPNRRHANQKTQEYIKGVGKDLGATVVYEDVEAELRKEGYKLDKDNIPDGYIDDDGVIHLSFYSVNPTRIVFKHELTHYGERYNKEGYDAYTLTLDKSKTFKSWLQEKTRSKSDSIGELKGLYRDIVVKSRGRLAPKSVTKQNSEMYADFSAEVLFEVSSFERLIKEVDHKQRPKFIQYVLDFLSYLKDKLSGKKGITFEIKQLESAYADMLREAKNNPTEQNGGVEFSVAKAKITYDMSDHERAEIIRKTKLHIVEFNDEKADLSGETVLKLKNTYKSQAQKILKPLAEKFGVFKDYKNENVEIEFNYSRSSLEESIHTENKRNANFYDFAKMLYVFEDVVLNARPIEIHTDKYVDTERENKNLKQVYVLLSAFRDGDSIIPVEFNIKEFLDETKNQLYVSVTLKKMKADLMGTPSEQSSYRIPKPTSIYSLSEIIKNVNSSDKDFLKYIPDELLNEEQISSKRIALSEEKIRLEAMRKEYADKRKQGHTFSVPATINQDSETNTEDDMSFVDIPNETQDILDMYDRGEITTEERDERLQELWSEAIKRYGQFPQGEKAAEDIPVPKKVAKDRPNRRFTRTMLESGKYTERMKADAAADILAGNQTYEVISDESAQKAADRIYTEGRAEKVWADAIANPYISKNTIAIGERLLTEALNNNDTATVLQIGAELSEVLTRAGQVVQSARMFKKMTPLGRVMTVQRMADVLNKDLKAKYGDDTKTIAPNPLLIEQLYGAETEADIETVMTDITTDMAAQVPATWLDKLNAYRYFCLLSNPRTHIRNLVGNTVFTIPVAMKMATGTVLEHMMIRDKGKRTKSVFIKKDYLNFAAKDFKTKEAQAMLKGTGQLDSKGQIMDMRKTFETEWLEKLTKGNSNLLEWEDMLFKSVHYKTALAGFLQARRIDLKKITQAQLDEARVYAVNEAKKATFQDASFIAERLNDAFRIPKRSRWSGDPDAEAVSFTARFLVEGVLPFKRTPINIVKRGVEYSPIGLVTTLMRGLESVRSKRMTMAQFCDGLAAGLTGTGVLVAGLLLASLGAVKGGFGDDDEDKFAKLNGEQEYSAIIGGKSYTVDWVAPSAIPFFIGVELASELDRDENITLADFGGAVWNALEPMTNLSMLSGIQGIIDAVRYEDGNRTIASVFGNAATSLAMQLVPSLLGSISRTIDPTQRIWYTDKNSKILDPTAQGVLNNIKSKLPGLSYTQAASIDAWGREKSRGGVGERIMENFISPGYYSEIDYDETEKELKRLYKETGENVFPQTAAKSFEVNGKTKYLTAAEWEIFAKAKGELSYDYIRDFTESDRYKKLTDGERADVILNLYKYANAKAKAEVSDYDPLADGSQFKAAARYEKNGGDVVLFYISRALKK